MAFIAGALRSIEGVFFLGNTEVGWWTISGVTLGLSLTFGLLLIGIPGALGMTMMQWALRRCGVPTPEYNQATWGIAILVSLALPVFIPIAHYALRWGIPRSFGSFLILGTVWSAILCLLGAITQAK